MGREHGVSSLISFLGMRQHPTGVCALQVLMSSPYKGEGRGIAMLNLLRTLSHSIAPAMADMWELEIPLLVRYLEGEVPGVPIPSTLPSECTGYGTDHVA